jgi:hypothetical protein
MKNHGEKTLVSFHRHVLLVLGLFFLICGAQAHAQFNSNIQGVVVDPSGAVVAGASVNLSNVDTGISSTAKTSESGNYRFNSLEPGNYFIKATSSGFEPSEVKITLQSSQTLGVNVKLQVSAQKETVTVSTVGPILNTDENRLETTIASEEIVELPQLNRNTWDTLTIAPGVSGTGTRGAGESPGGGADNFGTQTPALSANGRSYTGNLVMVDGMNVTSPVQNGNIILAV